MISRSPQVGFGADIKYSNWYCHLNFEQSDWVGSGEYESFDRVPCQPSCYEADLGYNRPGDEMEDGSYNNRPATKDECQRMCDSFPECVVFTHRPSDNRCRMHRAVRAKQSDVAYNSYVKSQECTTT